MTSKNLKFRGVGDHIILWNKVIKEVKLKRYAGPFKEPPFKFFIQSPIGLVPKDNGNDTRLIFHLSHPRGTGTSVNANTPEELCTVKYPDFSEAIRLCMREGKSCKISRSDMSAAFRNLCMSPASWKFLLMAAESPFDGQLYWFVDKALPFGSSISCSHFQRVSNGIAHIVTFNTGKCIVNYLDDYLFAALIRSMCNAQVEEFLRICATIGMPVSLEKTFWGTCLLTFLGFLIDTYNQTVSIPKDKVEKASEIISLLLNKKSHKLTLKQLQKLCGLLNFFCRCMVPGRAFTRRLYAYTAGKNFLKPHHHIKINTEMRMDLEMWSKFLQFPSAFCRPFMDFDHVLHAHEIDMYSDASKNSKLGFGATCGASWMMQKWDESFIRTHDPSIQFLELFGLTAGVLAWVHRFRNQRIILFCDNKGVCSMINNSSSSCKRCMVLIRLVVLYSLNHNVRVFAKYVKSKDNFFADMLSRLKTKRFWLKGKDKYVHKSTPVSSEIWPMEKVWYK